MNHEAVYRTALATPGLLNIESWSEVHERVNWVPAMRQSSHDPATAVQYGIALHQNCCYLKRPKGPVEMEILHLNQKYVRGSNMVGSKSG